MESKESKLREENKKLRAQLKDMKSSSGASAKGKEAPAGKAGGKKESMNDTMARLRAMRGKKKGR